MISGLVHWSVGSRLVIIRFGWDIRFMFVVCWFMISRFRGAVGSRGGEVSFSSRWVVWFGFMVCWFGLSIVVGLLIRIWGKQMRFFVTDIITAPVVIAIFTIEFLRFKMIKGNI